MGEAAVLGGAAEASGAAAVYQTAGVLPALGAGVLAFGAGVGIGTQICGVLGIEGCWDFTATEANPAIAGKGTWTFKTTAPCPGGNPPAFNWYAETEGGVVCGVFWRGMFGLKTGSSCGNTLPGPGQLSFEEKFGSECGTDPGVEFGKGWVARYSMGNRALTYNPVDDPGVANKSHTAPSDWSKKMASAIKGHEGDEAARVGQKIASEIEGSEVVNPYAVYVEVPASCQEGTKAPQCLVELEELELVPEVTELDWDQAVIEELDLLDPEKTREEESERIITIVPPPGTELETGSEVTVVTNPDVEQMPEFVPEADEGETGEETKERKFALPIWFPSVEELDDGSIDPSKGPNETVRTYPKAGTRVDPEAAPGSQEVTIYKNPPSAPPAAGAWTAPSIPSIDFGPLAGVAIGCNDFPFGVFCWIGAGLTSWGPGGECPTLGVPMGTSIGLSDELAFDTCQFEPAMEIVRPILILISAFSLAYLFAAAAMGFGGSTGSED